MIESWKTFLQTQGAAIEGGAVQHYGWFSAPSLIVMSLLMALGRLEIFAIAVLFMPSFWRQE